MSAEEIKKYIAILEDVQIEENVTMSKHDEDMSRSLNGLVKFNNGVWKSTKQRDFLLKLLTPEYQQDPEQMKTLYGISFDPASGDRTVAVITGKISFGEGRRATRPVGWAYVLDDTGVKTKYKLRWKEERFGPNKRDYSMQLDPSRVEIEWQRPADVDAAHLDAANQPTTTPPEAKKEGNFVGNPGERMKNVSVTIESVNGPYNSEYGAYYVTRLRDGADNLLVYLGKNLGEKGTNISMTFTVKKHDLDRKTQEKATQISRPTVKA